MSMLPPFFRTAADSIPRTKLQPKLAAMIGGLCFLSAASAAETPYLTAEEQLATFRLPPGYRLELVVGDPVIKEPVAIAFDGDGRMFVAEMRAFMNDLEGTGQREKNGRVSMHWSSKGDGVFDRHSVFIDGLVLPRMILPMDGALLVAETDSNDLHLYRDTDGDGVADKKDLWFSGGPRAQRRPPRRAHLAARVADRRPPRPRRARSEPRSAPARAPRARLPAAPAPARRAPRAAWC